MQSSLLTYVQMWKTMLQFTEVYGQNIQFAHLEKLVQTIRESRAEILRAVGISTKTKPSANTDPENCPIASVQRSTQPNTTPLAPGLLDAPSSAHPLIPGAEPFLYKA